MRIRMPSIHQKRERCQICRLDFNRGHFINEDLGSVEIHALKICNTK